MKRMLWVLAIIVGANALAGCDSPSSSPAPRSDASQAERSLDRIEKERSEANRGR